MHRLSKINTVYIDFLTKNMGNKKWFTFVELIVVVAILWILSTIWFISYTANLGTARDSKRISDIAIIGSALKQYKQQRWSYVIPSPGDNFYLLIASSTWAIQWTLNNKTTLSTLQTIPEDPEQKIYYSYSVTPNRQEYQIAATLENNDTPMALLDGDYSSVAKTILPTIVTATWSVSSIDVTLYDNLFIFDHQIHNLPYDFSGDNTPVSDGTSLSILLSEAEEDGDFWQNSDFQSCNEIYAAGKMFWSGSYQVVQPNTGILIDVGC